MDKTVSVEWRVETDETEDDFGYNEKGAREWFARAKAEGWEGVRLQSRTVTFSATAWKKVQ